jgi:hypothetical protein
MMTDWEGDRELAKQRFLKQQANSAEAKLTRLQFLSSCGAASAALASIRRNTAASPRPADSRL